MVVPATQERIDALIAWFRDQPYAEAVAALVNAGFVVRVYVPADSDCPIPADVDGVACMGNAGLPVLRFARCDCSAAHIEAHPPSDDDAAWLRDHAHGDES
jgi:hypothetical protein